MGMIQNDNDKCMCGAYWWENGYCSNGHPRWNGRLCECGGKYIAGHDDWPSRLVCNKCGNYYDLGEGDKIFNIDEGNLGNLSKEEKEKLIWEFLQMKVNKRCETCGFYAVNQKDVMEHAEGSGHGFVANGTVLFVGMFKAKT